MKEGIKGRKVYKEGRKRSIKESKIEGTEEENNKWILEGSKEGNKEQRKTRRKQGKKEGKEIKKRGKADRNEMKTEKMKNGRSEERKKNG